ncbi:MAG: hypothetical protein PHQ75_12325 [Thermoguttaceae bacterium]|nr:hypothetical protein [Thermoguttaceae bacterium]
MKYTNIIVVIIMLTLGEVAMSQSTSPVQAQSPVKAAGAVSPEAVQKANDLVNSAADMMNSAKKENRVPKVAKGTTYAILVGYSIFEKDKQHLPEYAQNDVVKLAQKLTQSGANGGQIVQMTSESREFYLRPSKTNIIAMLRLAAKRAGKNDTLWVMLSGTGTAVSDTACFLPEGATLGKSDQWLSEGEVRRILSDCPARQIIVLWLANRMNVSHIAPGSILALPRQDKQSASGPVKNQTRPKKQGDRFHIYGCSPEGVANESSEAGMDLFLSCFVSAMAKNAGRTSPDILTIFSQAKEETIARTGKFTNGPQKPVLKMF